MEQKKPLISIIIPVKDTPLDAFRNCIESVFHQTYRNLEIILIDDGSKNGAEQLCDYYAQMDSRCKAVHTPSCGVAAARNTGVRSCHGMYIGFIDSDDVADLCMIEELYKCIQHEATQMAVCGYERIKNGTVIKHSSGRSGKITSEMFFQSVLTDENIGSFLWNKLFQVDLFADLVFPEGSIYEDISVVYEAANKCREIAVTSECYYKYYFRKDSATYKVSEEESMMRFEQISRRNAQMLLEYPQLETAIHRNNLLVDILTWNSLAKNITYQTLRTKYAFLSKEVVKNRKEWNSLPIKYRLSYTGIRFFPAAYHRVLYSSNQRGFKK